MSDEAKPFAWAVIGEDYEYATLLEEHAGAVAEEEGGTVVPLYRQPQPTLTDAEREAVEWCASRPQTHWQHGIYAATLRGLLERMK